MLSICRSFAALALLARLAAASCECGYSINATSADQHEVFTEVLETDFLSLAKFSDIKDDWSIAKYRKPADESISSSGRQVEERNVITNPSKDSKDPTAEGKNGGDAGVQLIVRGGKNPKDDIVPAGEIKSKRTDMLYGSFRASMKVTPIKGTACVFFLYHNDTQIIDLELLSRQATESGQPVNLVLHSPESASSADASKTPSFRLVPLPFKPTEGFHEYRFDWTKGKVEFYADGKWLAEITVNVPEHSGQLLFAHWGSGRPGWTGGPPTEDATMTVQYAKAYFNSTEKARVSEYKDRCDISKEDAVCKVPEVKGAPKGVGYMFSKDEDKVHKPKTTVAAEAAQASSTTAADKDSGAGAFRVIGLAAVVPAAIAAWLVL